MDAEEAAVEMKNKMTDRKSRCYSEPSIRRAVRRPEEILRDVRGLKLRQRVSLVLGDEILREELEDTVRNSTVNGVSRLDTIRTFQDFLLPTHQSTFVGQSYASVWPINDIKGQETSNYSKKEKLLRCKLAAVYRLVDLKGWSEAIFNHISVRIGGKEEFLLNPFGLLFSEVTSSSLIKCDTDGNIIDGGSTSLGVNKAGFVLHSCIHQARPDILCIIHVHTQNAVAVSSMKCGFLRISQESLIVGGVSYHDYYGILVNEAEKESIKRDLGPENRVMFLRNHGVVVCGETVEETYLLLEYVMDACAIQVASMSVGIENLHIISEEAYEQVQDVVKTSKVINMTANKASATSDSSLAQYAFEAYMRWLDAQGYRTGYLYQRPDVFISGNVRKTPEARIPPTVTSDKAPHQVYHDYHSSDAVKRAQSMGRGNTYRNRLKWLNSPVQGTQYVKEEKKPSSENKQEEEEDEPVVNGDINGETLVNGHDELSTTTDSNTSKHEVVDKNETKVVKEDGTTIITQTKTVIKTKVVNEEIAETSSQVNGVNENTSVNGHEVVTSSDELLSPNKSSNSLNKPPSEAGSDNSERTKSPQKVKKQKSFKKALMKKLHKKEEKGK